ncbi:MAG: DUF6492 family protein [Pseudooceanicola sp.]
MTPGEAHIGPVPAAEAITFVTVSYREELALLRLQARSMARFLSPDLVGDILVIINDCAEDQAAAMVESLRPDYGALADKLRVVKGTDLFRWNVGPGGPMAWLRRFQSLHPYLALRSPGDAWNKHGGWKIQQVHKLACYRAITSGRIVMLDSKYHFLRPVRVDDYFAPDGRAYMMMDPVEQTRQDIIETSFRWFGLKPSDAGAMVTRGWMPFVIQTDLLKQATEAIEERTGPLQVLFAVHRKRETEAMLVNAFCLWRHGGIDQFFDGDISVPPIIVRGATEADIDAALTAAENGGALLALHRSVIPTLLPRHKDRLRALWRNAGLISQDAEADQILALRDQGNAAISAAVAG